MTAHDLRVSAAPLAVPPIQGSPTLLLRAVLMVVALGALTSACEIFTPLGEETEETIELVATTPYVAGDTIFDSTLVVRVEAAWPVGKLEWRVDDGEWRVPWTLDYGLLWLEHIPAGDRTVSVRMESEEGFHQWERTFHVAPGTAIYQVVELGLGPGAIVRDLDDEGNVVGRTASGQVFLWSDGVTTLIDGMTEVSRVAGGRVLGYKGSVQGVWSEGSWAAVSELCGGAVPVVGAIHAEGWIAGHTGPSHATIYRCRNGEAQTTEWGFPYHLEGAPVTAVNASGDVAFTLRWGMYPQGHLWKGDGGFLPMDSEVYALNDARETITRHRHALFHRLRREGTFVSDIPLPPSAWGANQINGAGVVISAYPRADGTPRPYLWHGGRVTYLETSDPEWRIEHVTRINDRGQLLATVIPAGGGAEQAIPVLLVPQGGEGDG